MRLTRMGKGLVAAVVLTAVVSIVAPTVGLVMAIVLAVVALLVLSQGFVTGGTGAHEVWTKVETERKREALRSRR